MIDFVLKMIENGTILIIIGILYIIQSLVYIKIKRYDQAIIFLAYALSFIGFLMAIKR